MVRSYITSPNPQAGGPPLVGCPQLLIQYIRSYFPNWRQFLHPEPEDAPCCGARDPLITDYPVYRSKILRSAHREYLIMCFV